MESQYPWVNVSVDQHWNPPPSYILWTAFSVWFHKSLMWNAHFKPTHQPSHFPQGYLVPLHSALVKEDCFKRYNAAYGYSDSLKASCTLCNSQLSQEEMRLCNILCNDVHVRLNNENRDGHFKQKINKFSIHWELFNNSSKIDDDPPRAHMREREIDWLSARSIWLSLH